MGNVIPELFFKSAAEFKDKTAFNYFDQTWKTITYDDLLRNAKGIASWLILNGIQKGDRIAIVSENRPEWGTAYLAISLSGAIAVPIDAQLGPDEIRNLLADSEAKVLFHSAKTEGNVRQAVSAIAYGRSLSVTLISFDSPEFSEILKTKESGQYPEIIGRRCCINHLYLRNYGQAERRDAHP